MSEDPHRVIAFWSSAGPAAWFAADPAFDAEIAAQFGALHAEAAAGKLAEWEQSPEGSLALILLLDQFSRNIHRGKPEAYAQDRMAQEIAARAIDHRLDHRASPGLRPFFYMPFMHAEDIALQRRSVHFFAGQPEKEQLSYALHHRDIIANFGRFPHRNAILGRSSTPEELAWLQDSPE
jgi:uncharacterized protein (DUF924 family)